MTINETAAACATRTTARDLEKAESESNEEPRGESTGGHLAARALLELRGSVWNFIAILRALGISDPADFLERALFSNIAREVHGSGGAA